MFGPFDILSVDSFCKYLLVDGGGDSFLLTAEELVISFSVFFRADLSCVGGTTPLTFDRVDD